MYNRDFILNTLESMSEKSYGEFSASLIPGEERMLGVRIPKLRAFAKKIVRGNYEEYLACAGVFENDSEILYFEEYALMGFVIGNIKADFDYVISYVKKFIPLINNWSVNDTVCSSLKIAEKNRERMWNFLMPYFQSDKEFEIRFATIMLMDYYLIEEYIDRVLEIYDNIHHDGYYAKMGVAWGLATAYAKFPEKTHNYMCRSNIDDWTYNRAIQKMTESYRVPDEAKKILRTMKRSKK